jgi:hypothetical protein
MAGIQMEVFSPSCCQLSVPSLLRELPLPGTTRFKGRSISPGETRSRVLFAQRNPEMLRNQLGNPTHQTDENLGLNSGLPQEAEEESDKLSKTPE